MLQRVENLIRKMAGAELFGREVFIREATQSAMGKIYEVRVEGSGEDFRLRKVVKETVVEAMCFGYLDFDDDTNEYQLSDKADRFFGKKEGGEK